MSKIRKPLCLVSIFLLVLLLAVGCDVTSALTPTGSGKPIAASQTLASVPAVIQTTTAASTVPALTNAETTAPGSSPKSPGNLVVHYIDVGQADSIFVQQDQDTLLIDAGNNADDALVVAYLQKLGIRDIDFVIGTHPHEDHIGGLDTVIRTFAIGRIIMSNASSTSQTFEDVLTAIQNKGMKMTKAVPGTDYALGRASLIILGPAQATYNDLNAASVVCKVVFGETSFLFAGDAEITSENAMLSQGYDVQADVLKIGHHGSSSSTGDSFLQAISPLYAIISVGKDNTYGHPAGSTLTRLQAAGVKTYRTDLAGTIVTTSDGTTIAFNSSPNYGTPGAVPTTAAPTAKPTTVKATTVKPTLQPGTSVTVYITNTGAKYHRDGCRYLSKSKIPISKSDAIAQGYTACSVCDP